MEAALCDLLLFLGQLFLMVRLGAGPFGKHGGGDCNGGQQRQRGNREPFCTGPATGSNGRCRDEVGLPAGKFRAQRPQQVARFFERLALWQQQIGRAVFLLPARQGRPNPPEHAQQLAVALQPSLDPRPVAQQRFMGHLHHRRPVFGRTGGEQAGLDEGIDQRRAGGVAAADSSIALRRATGSAPPAFTRTLSMRGSAACTSGGNAWNTSSARCASAPSTPPSSW